MSRVCKYGKSPHGCQTSCVRTYQGKSKKSPRRRDGTCPPPEDTQSLVYRFAWSNLTDSEIKREVYAYLDDQYKHSMYESYANTWGMRSSSDVDVVGKRVMELILELRKEIKKKHPTSLWKTVVKTVSSLFGSTRKRKRSSRRVSRRPDDLWGARHFN